MHRANGPSSNHRGGLEGDGSIAMAGPDKALSRNRRGLCSQPGRETGLEECENNRITSGTSHTAEGSPLVIRRQVQMRDFKVVPEKTSYSQGRGTWDPTPSCQQLWCIHC